MKPMFTPSFRPTVLDLFVPVIVDHKGMSSDVRDDHGFVQTFRSYTDAVTFAESAIERMEVK